MSQPNVERVIGRLVTDEAFRRRFAKSPVDALFEMMQSGVELTSLELRALFSIDPYLVGRFANALDPRIQRADVNGGRS